MTTQEEMIDKLKSELNYFGIELPSQNVMIQCVGICDEQNFTTEEFCEQWVSFSLFSKEDGEIERTPNEKSLETFKRYIVEQQEKQQKKGNKEVLKTVQPGSHNTIDPVLSIYSDSPTEKVSALKRQREDDDVDQFSKRPRETQCLHTGPKEEKSFSQIIEENLPPPTQSKQETESEMAAYYEKFSERKDKLKVVESFGTKISKHSFYNYGNDDKIVIHKSTETETLNNESRLYHDVKTMKMICMTQRIDTIGQYIICKHKLPEPEPFIALPYLPDDGVVYGRIVKNFAKGKMDKSTVLLESSAKFNQGEAVNLELHNVNKSAVFPGQIVAMAASKGRQGNITAKKIYSDAMLELPEKIPELNISGPLQIVVAAGPFTMSNNLSYEPLSELMTYVQEHNPHVLILTGPFLDPSHENIVSDTFTVAYESHFEALLKGIIKNLTEKQCTTKVIVVSSCKDIHHCNVYPTPPYHTEEKLKNLYFMPDPSIFSVNGVHIGITSTDILFHLNRESIFVSKSEHIVNRMSMIVKNIISQQCFYPLYPASKDICLDVQLLNKHGYFNETPHIMILPSNLRYFIKDIDGCVVMNPERLSKGCASGTFARIEVYPNQHLPSITNNIFCEILRI